MATIILSWALCSPTNGKVNGKAIQEAMATTTTITNTTLGDLFYVEQSLQV